MIKKIFKNRTYLGLFCIVLALIISFGITPLVNKKSSSQVEIVRVNKDIKQGEEITSDKIVSVKVGAYNLPPGVITNSDEVTSKFAKSDLYKGDFLFKEKVSNITKDYYLYSSFNENIAISATIKTSASGLSGKLKEGDIVTIIAKESEDGNPELIKELQYVKVLSTTTSEGLDKGEAEEENMPNTVTFAVNDIQAEKIAQLEVDGGIHIALVYRGEDEETVQAYLDVQNEYFEYLEENNLIDGIYELEGNQLEEGYEEIDE